MRDSFLALAAGFALVAAWPAPHFIGAAQAGCDAEDKIDKTTAGETKKKLEAAGYRQVTELMKGCDNTWHAKAMKDGAPARVAVSGTGQIMPEGD